jgi:hypothetical protein
MASDNLGEYSFTIDLYSEYIDGEEQEALLLCLKDVLAKIETIVPILNAHVERLEKELNYSEGQ